MEEIERRGRFSKSRKFPLTNANKENGICFQRSLQKISTEMRKQLLLWPSSCLGERCGYAAGKLCESENFLLIRSRPWSAWSELP
jgi:hypothetical protein